MSVLDTKVFFILRNFHNVCEKINFKHNFLVSSLLRNYYKVRNSVIGIL
ncbi:unnamed protein product [Brugia timori]|uniref:Uncharacterized protein n=1 Tax=Brugia timori TaxID=42155 RepID=A0A0R3QCK1_9BILA|nr:unnamed protein product [Brugia timori]